MSTPSVIVRDATDHDIPAVQHIYADHVLHGTGSFEEVPPSAPQMAMRWVDVHRLGLPYLVAELAGELVGYAYASAYRPRPAYRHTIEDSVYVARRHHRLGIGRTLLAALIARCEVGPWRQMIAVIGDSANTGSIVLHQHLGFRHAGTLENVGFKHGRWLDSVLMQRTLGQGAQVLPEPLARSGTGGR